MILVILFSSQRFDCIHEHENVWCFREEVVGMKMGFQKIENLKQEIADNSSLGRDTSHLLK